MTGDDYDNFCDVMKLTDIFYRKNIDLDFIDTYFLKLNHLPFEEVKFAIKTYTIFHCKKHLFPRPEDIILFNNLRINKMLPHLNELL
jgi:hypothetical protein